MFVSLNLLGSLVLDVDGGRLDAKFINNLGAVTDYFTLVKNMRRTLRRLSTSPLRRTAHPSRSQRTSRSAPTRPTPTEPSPEWSSTTAPTKLGEDTSSPYGMTWNNAPAGSHSLTARAVDNLGATTTSNPVNIMVTTQAPAAPTGLTANGIKRKVKLSWVQSSSAGVTQNRVYRSTVSGGPYSLIATLPRTTSYQDTAVTSGTQYYYVVTARNGSNQESGNSNQATATPR